ncbi:MAG: endonuclease/exonuclease/phosphatase family protein [Sumerlaeia bacterium]
MFNSSPFHCTRANLIFFTTLLIAPSAQAFSPGDGDFSKQNPDYIRVLSYNLEKKFITGTVEENAALDRILTTIQPDVMCLQEVVPGISTAELAARLESVLGGTWAVNLGTSDGFNRNVVASRFPFISQGNDSNPASELRGLTWAYIDLPDDQYTTDLYAISVHWKASGGASNDARRQIMADAAANWFADLTTPGGRATLPQNTPIMIVGDFNIADSFSQQPWETLLSGNIQDNQTYGPDRPGDWDGSQIAEFLVRDVYDLDFHTFPSGSNNPGSRLDRIAYTDSVATAAQGFILNDLSMTTQQRANAGLLFADTAAADHLPFAVDFALGGVQAQEPEYGDIIFTEIMANPTLVPDAAGEWFELHNWGETTYNLSGLMVYSNSTSGAGFTTDFLESNGPNNQINPSEYLLYGKSSNPQVNGGLPAAIALSNTGLNNQGDSLELWRGSIKIDGIRYGNGPTGEGPENTLWATASTPGISLALQGDLSNGKTAEVALSTVFYNPQDRGTPGAPNTVQPVPVVDLFYFY